MSSFSGRTDVASTIGDDEGGDLNLLVREIKESDWSSALASRFNALSLPNQFVVFVKMLHLGASKLADMAPDLRADFLKFSIPKFVTPLSMAACSGRKDFFEALLGRSDVDFNLAGENGFSPIHAAAPNGQIELVRYLIESCGVAVDANMPNGATSDLLNDTGISISEKSPLFGQLVSGPNGLPVKGKVLSSEDVMNEKVWPEFSSILAKEYVEVPGTGVVL